MDRIKIYGAPTSRYEYFKHKLQNYLKENDIDVAVEEVNNVEQLILDKVVSIPTLRINDHIDLSYNENQGIEQFIAEALETIVQEFAPEKVTRILVPTDFSDVSLNAYLYAKELIKSSEGIIDLLYVNHPSPIVINGVVIEDKFDKKEKLSQLKRIATTESIRFEDDSEQHMQWIKPKYKEGLAAEEIIDESEHVDMIIMGTTGENDALKKLIGSVSVKVAEKAKCPVLLVPNDSTYKGIKKIVYAYSPTSYDYKSLEELEEMSLRFDAAVYLVHVDDGTPYQEYDIKSYLEHMYENLEFHHDIISADSVAFGINQYAEKIGADLIIVSKRKRNILEQLFEKSHTKSTILKTKIPVMVFHEDDHICKCGGKCKKIENFKCKH